MLQRGSVVLTTLCPLVIESAIPGILESLDLFVFVKIPVHLDCPPTFSFLFLRLLGFTEVSSNLLCSRELGVLLAKPLQSQRCNGLLKLSIRIP